MNKYLTFAGLQPVYLGDVDFLQEATRNALSLILQGLTGTEKPNCILVQPTQNKEGVVCVDGEILPYRYGQKSATSSVAVRVISEYGGERMFKNGETHACHETRYAQNEAASSSDPYYISKFTDLTKLMVTRFAYQKTRELVRFDETQIAFITTTLGSNRCQVDVEMEQVDDTAQKLKELIANVSVALPGQFAGTYYAVMSAEIEGTLKLLPAKVECVYESAQRCKATITIPETQISVRSKGLISLTITK